MLTKEHFLEFIDKLPSQFSIDQLIEHAILLEKIEKGLKDSDEDQVFSVEEMQQKIEKWFE